MTSNQSSRQEALVEKLLAEYQPGPKGSSVDSDRIRSIVTTDPDLIAEVFPVLLEWNIHHSVGIWGLLFTIAKVYQIECRDDSLSVLLETSARDANITLPSLLSITPHEVPSNQKVHELQMADADVRAGDAHRVLTTMNVETMSSEMRERVIGNCIISFPVSNDPRPIQQIPEVRRFIADLHQRMRYFPMYLNFDRKYRMHLVYFGCLADQTAFVAVGNETGVNMLHDSFIRKMKESLYAIRDKCQLLGIDWRPSVHGILAVFDCNTRANLFGRDWDV